MDELAVVDVDADMRHGLAASAEEHEVARLHVVALDLQAGEELAGRVGREIEADALHEDVADETAAVEAGGGHPAAALVTDVTQLHGEGKEGFASVAIDVAGELGGG